MLKDSHGFSGLSTNAIDATRVFFGEALGLEVTDEDGILTLHLARGAGWCSRVKA